MATLLTLTSIWVLILAPTKRIRLAGIDTPESRTADAFEKKLGLQAKEWLKHKLENAKDILIKTELPDSTEKYGRIIGHLFINGEAVSINNQMIAEGHAWNYDGGTKAKNFNILKEIRISKGTWTEA